MGIHVQSKKARQTELHVDKCAYAWKPVNKRGENKEKKKRERARLFATLSQEGSSECIFSLHFLIWLLRHNCRSDYEQSMLVRHPSSGEERNCWIFHPILQCGNLLLHCNTPWEGESKFDVSTERGGLGKHCISKLSLKLLFLITAISEIQ